MNIDEDEDDIRNEREAARRRNRYGWGFDERTGRYDYCPRDPQRQSSDEDKEEEDDNEE